MGIWMKVCPLLTLPDQDDGVGRAIGLALLEKDAEGHIRLSDEVEKILAFVSEVQSVEVPEVGARCGVGECVPG